MPLVFLLMLELGAVSYSARTPGGLSPRCSCYGRNSDCSSRPASSLFPACRFSRKDSPWSGWSPCSLASFGRTGIVLVTEMTAEVTMLLQCWGRAMAMLTPTLIKDPPIYDSLRERTVKRERARLD